MSNLTASHKELTMTNQTPLPLRSDTILGVCEAIGQDFGFNPTWLRLAFIVPLFFAPYWAVGAYFGLGLIVAATHWFVKDQKPAEAVDVQATEIEEEEKLAIAA